MSDREIAADPFAKIWKFFASVRLTIVLLLTLAATSIIGTLIPQNESPEAYFRAFGPFLFRFFDVLGLFDMYHSWWFQSLMLLLAANVLICSIERLSSTWRIIFVRNPSFNLERFRRLKPKEEFGDNRNAGALKESYSAVIARSFRYWRVAETDNNGFAIYGEKGRWTRLGVYIVHLSVILMLVGGVIGSIFGFEGFVNIAEGDSAQQIRIRNSGEIRKLDFAIRCDDFDISFYTTGAPKEFRSRLTILEQGKPLLSKDIIVNDPLHYKGISIFQSSYGQLAPQDQGLTPPGEVTLSFTSKATGMIYEKKAAIGRQIDIPENLGKFVITEFNTNYNFRGKDLGGAFVGILYQTDGAQIEVVLPIRFPSFDRMGPMFSKNRKDDVFISVSDVDVKQEPAIARYFTGLQVTRDPGVWVVYAGFILMIIGCYITFFMSHQQICVEVIDKGKKSRVMVAGTSNKNKLANARKISKMAHTLANLEQRA
jgi:cytochrome c biogenesis protein